MQRGAFVSEPAIMVKRKGRSSQVWSVEKLDLKLTDLRELSQSDGFNALTDDDAEEDPFYENTESHNLIGVANLFLSCLTHDIAFDYYTPIISQQGEVAGRLQVQIQRTEGSFPAMERSSMSAQGDTNSEASSSTASSSRFSNGDANCSGSEEGSNVVVQVGI